MDMVVKVGDNVLYGKYDGSEVEYDGQTHQLIRDDDLASQHFVGLVTVNFIPS